MEYVVACSVNMCCLQRPKQLTLALISQTRISVSLAERVWVVFNMSSCCLLSVMICAKLKTLCSINNNRQTMSGNKYNVIRGSIWISATLLFLIESLRSL